MSALPFILQLMSVLPCYSPIDMSALSVILWPICQYFPLFSGRYVSTSRYSPANVSTSPLFSNWYVSTSCYCPADTSALPVILRPICQHFPVILQLICQHFPLFSGRYVSTSRYSPADMSVLPVILLLMSVLIPYSPANVSTSLLFARWYVSTSPLLSGCNVGTSP
jgi:hypothetical protein